MTLIGICKLLRRSEDRPSVHALVATASVSWRVMLIVFLQQEIDVFKDQSLHFPQDMRGNAAIPGKAHWIEPEFAFTLRTSNVDVGPLCALVGVKVKPKLAYSEYCGHVIRVLPLGHAGKFCCGRGGDVTASPLDNAMCRAPPEGASPALRRFLRHVLAKPR